MPNEKEPGTTGPTLETYVETRLNLLTESIADKQAAQASALGSAIEASKAALLAIKASMEASQMAADLRYQQRFEAQSDALKAAFLSQQTAMQTALAAAEKAVQAALASADRAVSKAEMAAEKRFEAVNEFRGMLNDTLTNLITRPEALQHIQTLTDKIDVLNRRNEELEKRSNTAAGEIAGGRQTKDDSKAMWAIAVAIVAVLISAAVMVIGFFKG